MIEVGKNSYVSLEEAEEYLQTRLDTEDWLDKDDSVKQKALITATRTLDMYNYQGRKVEESQPLKFPRVNDRSRRLIHKYYDEYNTIPVEIKQATIELSLHFLTNQSLTNQLQSMKSMGVDSYDIGGVNVSFKNDKDDNLPSMVTKLISPYLRRTGKLVR